MEREFNISMINILNEIRKIFAIFLKQNQVKMLDLKKSEVFTSFTAEHEHGYILKSLRSGERMCPRIENPNATVVTNSAAASLLGNLDTLHQRYS